MSNVESTPPQSPSSSSAGAPPASPSSTPETQSSAEPSHEEKVKALVKHAEEKHAKKNGRAPEKTEAKPNTADNGKPDKADEVVQSADGKDKPADKPDAQPPKRDPEAEEAKRIARIAEAENRARAAREALTTERKAFEEEKVSHKQNLDAWSTFTSTFPQDPVKALRSLGLKDEHLNALYWRLNDDALKPKGALTEKDVETRAREIAAQEFKRLQEEQSKASQQQFGTAMDKAREMYTQRVAATFEAAKDKFPAIAALGVATGDIHSYLDDQFRDTGKVPTPEEVLTHFENKHQKQIEAAGYSRKTVEAPKAEVNQPKAAKTITAGWQNGSDPGKNEDTPRPSQSLKESRDEIRKKLDQGFYKRDSKRA